MKAAKIPTPEGWAFDTFYDVERFLKANWKSECPHVIKCDTFIDHPHYRVVLPNTLGEALAACDFLMRSGPEDVRTQRVLIEERLYGSEISLHIITDGENFQFLPLVRKWSIKMVPCTEPIVHLS